MNKKSVLFTILFSLAISAVFSIEIKAQEMDMPTAIVRGNVDRVRELLDSGFNPNEKMKRAAVQYPLLIAVENHKI